MSPRSRRARGGGRPPISTVPAVASPSPAIRRSSVLFPEPDGPTRETNSPSRVAKLMSLSASVPSLYRFWTPSSSTSTAPLAAASLTACAGSGEESGGEGLLHIHLVQGDTDRLQLLLERHPAGHGHGADATVRSIPAHDQRPGLFDVEPHRIQGEGIILAAGRRLHKAIGRRGILEIRIPALQGGLDEGMDHVGVLLDLPL